LEETAEIMDAGRRELLGIDIGSDDLRKGSKARKVVKDPRRTLFDL